MHYNESTWSVEQLDHFSQTHFVQSKSKQINHNFFCQDPFDEGIIIFFGSIEQNHILSSWNFLRRPHLCFEIGLNNFSRSMSARSTYKHANSGGHYVSFTERNSNVHGLSKSSFISFIDINDRIRFYIIDSSDDFIPILCKRNNKSFGNLRVAKLWL